MIPARRGWTVLLLAAWLAMWTSGGSAAMDRAVPHGGLSRMDAGNLFHALWLVGWTFGEWTAAASIVWALGGRTVLRLDPSVLDLERTLFGLSLGVRSFPTGEVRNLRLQPADRRGDSDRPAGICFEAGDRTIRLGSGVSDAEALAVIDTMLEVYPFPRERALEYLDLSR